MKKVLIGVVIGVAICLLGYGIRPSIQSYIESGGVISPIGIKKDLPFAKYTINALSGRRFSGSQIVLDDAVATTSVYTKYVFHFDSDGANVTGVAYLPRVATTALKAPVIVQFRGYVDSAKYTPGMGTEHSAEVFAQNGFISLAPDFLGYGGSASGAANGFEDRFQTYTTALNLLASIHSLPGADPTRVGLWGHSNGGQIAITVSEILNRPIPVSLWAPVSKPFPYSILYYTDDIDDHGKALRKALADFEKRYDAEQYSLTNYLRRIVGPIQISQGEADAAVPVAWSDLLVNTLKELRKDATDVGEVNYFTYPEADHNLTPGWNTVMARDIAFFSKYLRLGSGK